MIDIPIRVLSGLHSVSRRAWPFGRLDARFDTFTERLNAIEAVMYSHTEPAETVPMRAPEFSLPGLTGDVVHLDRLLALGKPVLLLFTDPAGPTGQSLLAMVGAWQRTHGAPITAVGISPAGRSPALSRSDLPAGITDVLMPPPDRRTAADYGVTLTPAAVLIRPNGALVGGPVVGMNGIERMLDAIAASAAEAKRMRESQVEESAPAVGALAPRVLLPGHDDIDHDVVVHGVAQVLLFWSPDCGYCDQLAADLHALETSPRPGLPSITLVARGSEADNRAQGFGFRTLFDHDLSASSAFGVNGTPAAVIVDGDGYVASHVARGVRSVRELLALTAPTS